MGGVTSAPMFGFAGLGDIGLPTAERLLDEVGQLVVYNRTASKAATLVARRAVLVPTPADLAARVDVVITCLHGPEADRSVYLGPDGLLTADVAGKLFVNTSTIGPDLARELAAAVEAAGGEYVDCPLLGGGREAARSGTLLVPVGASADGFRRAEPHLRHVATSVEHVGPVGSAQVLKLANNIQVGIHAAALAQAVRMAVAGGVDPDALAELLPQASSHSRSMDRYLSAMLDRRFEERGTLQTLGKDVDVAVAFARSVNAPCSLGAAAAEVFDRALADGRGSLDVPALVEVSSS